MTKPLCLSSLLVLATSSLLSPHAIAEPLAEALTECRQQQNALKRLVCYDEISIAVSVSSAVAVSTPPAPASPTPITTTPAAAPSFGLEHKNAAEEQADQLYFTVSNISYSPRKELIVEFDNGQIWRQNGSAFYNINVGEQHFIKKGMFNSFTLGNDGNNRNIKVRRVQ